MGVDIMDDASHISFEDGVRKACHERRANDIVIDW